MAKKKESKMREMLKTFDRRVVPKKGKKGGRKGLIADPCNEWMRTQKSYTREDLLEYAEYLAGSISTAFLNQFTEGTQPWRLRPSDQKCSRLSALKKLGKGSGIPPEKDGTFFVGHMAEAYSKAVARLAGCDVRNFNQKVKIPIPGQTCPVCKNEGYCICSEIDCTLTYGKGLYVVDYKSCSPRAWPYLDSNFAKDSWGYAKQLRLYMMSKEYLGKVKGGLIVYVDKGDWNRWKEFYVPAPTEEDMEAWLTHCAVVGNATAKKLPKKPHWATSRKTYITKPKRDVEKLSDIRCILCEAQEACWGKGFYAREDKVEAIRNV